MIELYVEIDGEEVHMQFTDENSHFMIVFDSLKEFDDFMKQLEKQRRKLTQKTRGD